MEEADGNFLCKPVERVEIENTIRFANPNKASGPDGFIAHYYKVWWPIAGEDVTIAISEFFKHGKLLKQIKHTFFFLFQNPTIQRHREILDLYL